MSPFTVDTDIVKVFDSGCSYKLEASMNLSMNLWSR